jgi:glutamate dehydrogenase (NAD(P)+)
VTAPELVRAVDVHRLNAGSVLAGANVPFTTGAKSTRHERDAFVVPDFSANAGGMMGAAIDDAGAAQAAAPRVIEEKILAYARPVLEAARRQRTPPGEAAPEIATRRVRAATATRRDS